MSTDLVTISDELVPQQGRRAFLQRLSDAAQQASTPEEAHRLMQQGSVVAEALHRMREPFEDCWLAGKASVLAARKLGQLLNQLSADRTRAPGDKGGFLPSERSMLRDALKINAKTARQLTRLATVPDPEFQRYIQRRDQIPTLHGVLSACRIAPDVRRGAHPDWQSQRRKSLGVVTPANPSLDEAASLIVKALGHLGATGLNGGSRERQRARSQAMDLLYGAHDLIRPYLGGYVK